MSPLSPKQDLILSADHHKILPWPSLGPEDGDFNPDQYLNDIDDDTPGMILSADDLLANGSSDPQLSHFPSAADTSPDPTSAGTATTQTGPVTPADGAASPSQTHQSSPASATDPANLMSPTLQEGDRSSSLSPVPEPDQSSAEQHPPQATDAAAGGKQPRQEEEEEEEAANNASSRLSRLSTPLSPLSPPPQEEEEEELAALNQDSAQKDGGEGHSHKSGQAGSQALDGSRSVTASASTKTNIPMGLGNSNSESSAGGANGVESGQPRSQHQRQKQQAEAINNNPGGLNTGSPGTELPSAGARGGNVSPALMQPSRLASSLSASSATGSSAHPQGSSAAATSPVGSTSSVHTSGLESTDPKAALILELNVELLKICMIFQAKGVPPNDPMLRNYSQRLQSNLAWGAAAVDQETPTNQNVTDPILDPPPPLDFASTDRIRQIYTELSAAFTKEHARRQRQALMAASHSPANPINRSPIIPPSTGMMKPNAGGLALNPAFANLKRERPEDQGGDAVGNISKRRDTGEHKMMPPPTSIPISSGPTPPQNIAPSMPHHSIGGGLNGVANRGQGQEHPPMSAPQASNPLQPQNMVMQHQQPQSRPPSQQSMARQSPGVLDPSTSPSMMNMNQAEAAMAAQRAKQMGMRAAQQQGVGGPGGRPMTAQGMQHGAQGQQGQPPQLQQQIQQQQIQQQQLLQQQGQSSGGMQGAPPGGVSGGQGGPLNLASLPPQFHSAYQILQNPNHPFVQHLVTRIPGFKSMPVMNQLQKVFQMQMYMTQQQQKGDQQTQQQQQQQQNVMAAAGRAGGGGGGNPMQQALAASGNMAMQGGMGGSAGFATPTSPISHQGNAMFPSGSGGQAQGGGMGGGGGGGGGTMDPRMLSGSSMQGNSMQAGPSGMNLGNMSAHQRQLFLLQQQARMGGGTSGMGAPGAGGMNMNQNMAFAQQQQQHQQQQQQQQHMRQMQEQRMAQQQAQMQSQQLQSMQMGSPTHSNSMAQQNMMGGMGGVSGDFPAALRSNPQIQGISRNAWSPTGDGGGSTPSPMTPRIGGGSASGNQQMRVSQEDYQRLLMQQQQQQAARVMTSSPGFGPGQVQGMKWPQQQHQHQQGQGQGGMGMGGGMGLGGGNYGMSPPGSAGGGTNVAPSPPGGGQQNWGAGPTSGGYPFSNLSGGGQGGMDPMRHMSGTPGPQQMQGMGHGQMSGMGGGDGGGSIPNEFDLFNWNG